MDLIASVSSRKVKAFNFLVIRGIFRGSDLFFLFDTGAACPLLGVNSFFDNDDIDNKRRFENILKLEIGDQDIKPRAVPLKAANNQAIETFPCVCHHTSVEDTRERDFYFDISFSDVSIPLLGSSFIDDCAYSHIINGNVNITSIKENVGKDYYSGYKVLDFDKVVRRFEGFLKQ